MADVYINGRFLGQRITGVQRFGREVLLALDASLADAGDLRNGIRFTVLVPPATDTPDFRHLQVEAIGRAGGHAWEQIDLPWRTRGELLINLGFTGPICKRNQIITVHDGAVVRMPEGYSRQFRLWYRLAVGLIGRRAPMTVAVSQFSAGEATECFGVPADRIHVSGEGWDHIRNVNADRSILDRFNLGNGDYFLVVSSPARHKNFPVVAEALRLLGKQAPRCIAVGAADKRVFRGAGENAGGIEHLGYVSDAELKALYERAIGFIMPSFYEGFGIPPLEAMACNATVISSTAAALREVCADAAVYFEPESAVQLATAIASVRAKPELRAALADAARQRLANYSWRSAATCYLDLARRCLGRTLGAGA